MQNETVENIAIDFNNIDYEYYFPNKKFAIFICDKAHESLVASPTRERYLRTIDRMIKFLMHELKNDEFDMRERFQEFLEEEGFYVNVSDILKIR